MRFMTIDKYHLIKDTETIGDILIDTDRIGFIDEDTKYIEGFGLPSIHNVYLRWVLIGNFLEYTKEELSNYVANLGWGKKNVYNQSNLVQIIDISTDLVARHIYVFNCYTVSKDYFSNYKPTDEAMLSHDFSKWLIRQLKKEPSQKAC